MKERKNLENLFQERFDNFEVQPPEMVWEEIKIKLEEKEKKRIIPFWWKLSGIAAALIIGLFIINNSTDSKPNEQIITNSNVANPIDTNTSNGNDLKKPENSVANSDAKEKSETVDNVNKNSGSQSNNNQNSVATSNQKNSSTKANKQINTSSDKTNNLLKNNNAVAESSSENNLVKNSAEKSTIYKTTKNKKVVKNSSESIAVNADKDPKTNNFYNYKNNKVVVAEKLLSTEISSDKTASNFNKKKTFASLKSDKIGTENSIAVENSNENSILNIKSKTERNSTTLLNSGINIASNTNKSDTNTLENKTSELKIIEENKKIDSTTIAIVEPNALEELLKEKEKKIAQGPKLNRWQVTTNVAPIYFSSTGKEGSALDSKFEKNSKSYSTNYSYGVGVNYKVAKKLKVRAGINSLSFNYDTNDVVFYQSPVTSKIKNIDTNQSGSFIQIENKNNVASSTPTIEESGYNLTKFESSINQKLGYIEVPLEMSYTVLDKKFSIEVVGGLSTLFLNQNQIYLESSGLKMEIGEANNLNDVHFSGNIGLGFKYGILKNLEAKVEPVLKYQMNTYTTNTGDFKPYFIGVYTGLSYNF